MYYLQSSLSEVSKLEQEHVIDYMTSEVGLSSYPDANILMSLKSKAVSPIIKSICLQFDELLQTIVKDITEYISNDDDNELKSIEKWNPETETWSEVEDQLEEKRSGFGLVAFPKSRVCTSK